MNTYVLKYIKNNLVVMNLTYQTKRDSGGMELGVPARGRR